MDNIEIENKIKSATKIKNIYDNLTYLDQYGNSVFLFLIITTILVLAHTYLRVMINIQPIKDDWINQRCKPNIIPLAGFINKPIDQTITEYTSDNFTFCVQGILKNITGYALEPIQFVTNTFQSIFDGMKEEINSIRNMINNVRTAMQETAQEILGRILNMLIPLQQMIIAFKDIMGKVQGTLTAGLFTSLGVYLTLKSALGAVVNLIITILIILLAMILPLVAMPITYPAAVPLIAIFVAISVPLTIILVTLTETLGIKPNNPIPSFCFDKNTLIDMYDGSKKSISEIVVGEKLKNGDIVTATLKFPANNVDMYNLNGVIVSGSHIIKYVKNDIYNQVNWIPVRAHPERKPIHEYLEPYIYCMNTSSKEIIINNLTFSDWDELYKTEDKEKLYSFLKYYCSLNEGFDNSLFHKYLDGGFSGETIIPLNNGSCKKIKDIQINDVLLNNIKVQSTVKIDGNNLISQYEYILGKNKQRFIGGPNVNIFEFKEDDTNILNERIHLNKLNKEKEEKILYHLTTNKHYFHICNDKLKVYDYYSCVEIFADNDNTLDLELEL